MVTFGGYSLPNVSEITTQDCRVMNEYVIPSAEIAARTDQTMGGRIITVTGQIRDIDMVLRVDELRARQDGTARDLDLEDGSDPLNMRLGEVIITWTAEDGLDRPAYEATFYETS